MSSRALGVLSLDLLVKTGAFTAGMDAAERKTQKTMSAIEKRAYAFGRNLGAGIKLAGTAIAGTGALLGGIYLKNTIEAEKVSAALDARIKALGGSAAVSAKTVKGLADSLQAASTFDDESITQASTALLAFTNIGAPEFARTLSAALDLAASSGDDLTATAEKLGKALNEPDKAAKALRDTGIALSDSQKKLIKNLTDAGKVGEAQGILLGELEKRYKGAAVAARDTMGGALAALKNAFDNVLEGDSGSAGIKGTTDAINSLTDSLNDPDVKAGVDNIVGGIASIVAECVEGIGALQRFGENVNTVFDISEKVSRGAPLTDFNDRELQVRLANLSEQKTKAKQGGNQAEVDRLQKLITAAIRENTARINKTIFEGVTAAVSTTYGEKPAAAAGGGSGSRSRSGGASTGTRNDEAAKQAEEAQRALLEAAQAQSEWHEQILDMQASLAGPTAEIMREYQKQMADLDGEFAAGKIKLDDYATAQDLVTQKRDTDLKKIDDQLTPYEEVNAAIQEQIKLLTMSAEQQEIYNNQKAAGVEANSAFGQSIAASTEELQAAREAQDAIDGFKDATEDLFASMIDGSKSAKEAFADFGQSILQEAARVLAHKAVQSLFSMFSTSGMPTGATGDVAMGANSYSGAAGGSWWSSLLSAFGGGGRAAGGRVEPWSIHPVNELGMEGLTVNGKDYLMTGSQSGVVTPSRARGGIGYDRPVVNQTIQVTGTVDPRSASQIAVETSRRLQMAMARNR